MLDLKIVKQIEDFVSKKPRSMQDIAFMLKKNWRTADRYIDYIKNNFGTISTETFREGTRGALKIAYWASISDRKYSVFQENLREQIELFKNKEDFSAFDIYQHIPDANKKANIEIVKDEKSTNIEELFDLILTAKKQLLIFSGNLSFINFENEKMSVLKILDDLIKKNVSIKILCRVDIAGMENIENILSLNFKYGKESVEIRHIEQPLRAIIIDDKLFRMKEIKEPTGKKYELGKKTFIFYTVKDKEWVEWLSRIFWNLFSKSMDSKKRMEQIRKIISK
ncbi:hypothetical protein HYV89_01295 [Candidatus Woesearchaeota archaeon]|nr:hypothetical protein [Candidatus Woesearchaeota archaeon]